MAPERKKEEKKKEELWKFASKEVLSTPEGVNDFIITLQRLYGKKFFLGGSWRLKLLFDKDDAIKPADIDIFIRRREHIPGLRTDEKEAMILASYLQYRGIPLSVKVLDPRFTGKEEYERLTHPLASLFIVGPFRERKGEKMIQRLKYILRRLRSIREKSEAAYRFLVDDIAHGMATILKASPPRGYARELYKGWDELLQRESFEPWEKDIIREIRAAVERYHPSTTKSLTPRDIKAFIMSATKRAEPQIRKRRSL